MADITHATICIRAEDAFEFLQAQLTTDLNELAHAIDAPPQRTAWCNPKGRVICIADISRSIDGFEMSLPSDLAELVVQRMTMFRFRSKVEFDVQAGRISSAESELDRLRAGIPQITAAESEKFTPHMLNLDLLGIVSLDKGCYPGQEIVARTHYRGASKRRCLRFESAEPVSAGDKVSDGSRDIGEVVNAIGTDLLAVVPVDAAQTALSIDGAALQKQDLPYDV